MRVVVTGSSGMIGSTIARIANEHYKVIGVGRKKMSSVDLGFDYRDFRDLASEDGVRQFYADFRPNIVINCAGLTKHHPDGNNPSSAVRANVILPHLLSSEAYKQGCKFIHVSTDCVFRGDQGNYHETSLPDADDLYGKTKAVGELLQKSHLVLRTSTIGHEYGSKFGLLEWFLGTNLKCRGFTNAFFSGLTTVELANLLVRFVLPKNDLRGLYNVGGKRIDKYSLLKIIAEVYSHDIDLVADDDFKIDRSFNSSKFCNKTGYELPTWRGLIEEMFSDWSNRKNDI